MDMSKLEVGIIGDMMRGFFALPSLSPPLRGRGGRREGALSNLEPLIPCRRRSVTTGLTGSVNCRWGRLNELINRRVMRGANGGVVW